MDSQETPSSSDDTYKHKTESKIRKLFEKKDPFPTIILPLRHNKGKPISNRLVQKTKSDITHKSPHEAYFKELDIDRKLEADIASNFTIDVQPDQSFTYAYILSTTQLEYPNFDKKEIL